MSSNPSGPSRRVGRESAAAPRPEPLPAPPAPAPRPSHTPVPPPPKLSGRTSSAPLVRDDRWPRRRLQVVLLAALLGVAILLALGWWSHRPASQHDEHSDTATTTAERPPGPDAATCLTLARNAARAGKDEQVEEFTHAALSACRDLPADAPVALEARAWAAWAALGHERLIEVREQLPALRGGPKPYPALAHLLEGLVAVRQGRYEDGIHELAPVVEDPAFAGQLLPHVALGQACLALGRYDPALRQFLAVKQLQESGEAARPLEETLVRTFQLSHDDLYLALCRCHLGLGLSDEAIHDRAQLRDSRSLTAATLHFAQYHLKRAREQRAAGDAAASWSLDQVRRELATVRRAAPNDPDLPALEAELAREEEKR